MIGTIVLIGAVGATVLLGVGNSGLYGRHAAKKYGVVYSEAAVTDGGTAAQGEIGQIVIDGTDGKISYVDTSGKTQDLS